MGAPGWKCANCAKNEYNSGADTDKNRQNRINSDDFTQKHNTPGTPMGGRLEMKIFDQKNAGTESEESK